jgi:transposase InsO family protein
MANLSEACKRIESGAEWPIRHIRTVWQTDFTYLKVIGWGWSYLSTVLDDFSRYIIAWKLCTTMKTEDVTATLELALKASGLDQAKAIHRPRLLSDNGSSYIAADLAKWLDGQNMEHVRGVPYHPMTQGKIERWHQTLKNRILLENYRESLPVGRSGSRKLRCRVSRDDERLPFDKRALHH